MRAEHGAGESLAAATFTAYALALAAGRAVGDRLVARHGRLRIVRGGALLGAAGVAGAVVSPGAVGAVAGWVLVGLGLAAATPAIIGAAPAVAGMPVPAAIAAITSISYLGSFTGPPLIGVLAGAAGLSPALGVAVVFGLAMAALAGPGLRPRRASRQPCGGS
jgi:MFS family permease